MSDDAGTDAESSTDASTREHGENVPSHPNTERPDATLPDDDPDEALRDADETPADTDEELHDSLLAALHVRQHLRVGLAVGIALAAFLYVPRVPTFDASIAGAEGYYLGLAFVLAATTAGLLTAALSIKQFLHPVLNRPAWLRRGGVAAMLGGLGWASAPLVAAAADAGAISPLLWRNATSFASVALLVGTIGLHATVTAGIDDVDSMLRRVERGAYWLVLVGLLIAAANATGDASAMTATGDAASASGDDPIATPFLIGALLAAVAAIPFAAVGELTGELPRWRIRALLAGGLLSTLGIAWLVSLGGWDWLVTADVAAEPAALAVALVPAGLGWTIAGLGCWAAAATQRRPTTPAAGTGTERDDE